MSFGGQDIFMANINWILSIIVIDKNKQKKI